MPLRIALTHAFCWPEVRRGGERYLHELASAMARRGHNVSIIAGAKRPGRSHEEGVRVFRVARRRGRSVLDAEKSFGRWVAGPLLTGAYDVVHSLGVRDAATSIAVKRLRGNRRTVYTNLGIPKRPRRDNQPDAGAHIKVVADVDVYGCLSEHVREVFEAGYGRRGVLTPGGVDLRRFQAKVRRTSDPTLLYCGALDLPRKGVAELLEAVAVLAKSEPRVKLWLSGQGDPSKVLSAAPLAARQRTEVLGVGAVSDLPRTYGSAWATVLPSRAEAFGLVLVESLACGTPIVANNDASLPGLVDPGCGLVTEAGDPHDLAEACGRALGLATDPATPDRCRDAAGRHDWDKSVAPAIEAFYMGAGRDSGLES